MDSVDLTSDEEVFWQNDLELENELNNIDMGPPQHVDDKPQKRHLDSLLKYFGHTVFRPMQWQIINSVLKDKRDNCAIMATGYGKSLCYQYPAVFSNGLSIVISPLISLMEDQVQALEVANIPACFLGTAQSKKREVLSDLIDGVFRVVYMTPEYASGDCGRELLPQLCESNNVTVLAIDEAHCVSQWGHDFRPAYRGLGRIRQLMPSVPILAVTATATENVRNDIIKSLGLRNPQVLCTGFDRPNLYFKVQKKSADMYADITDVLTKEKKLFNIANGSVIIYCLTKKNTETVVELLKGHGLKCESYHAGLSIKTRKAVHEQFLRDEIKIIVATIAFGMGIDKPNVRCVIHYGTSSDMEGYYQEAGRAGRDGNPSLCILYHSPADFVTHNFLRDKSLMSSKVKSHKESLNAVMKQYISVRECRRHFIISYFEKDRPSPSSPQTNCCDNCTKRMSSPNDLAKYEGLDDEGNYDFTEDTEKFLKAVEYFKPKAFGAGMIISFLRGSKAKKMNPKCFTSELHGAGLSKTEIWWKQIAFLLENEKFIKKESIKMGASSFPVIVMDRKGELWLRDKNRGQHMPLLLQPPDDIIQCLKVKIVKPLYSDESTSKGNSNFFEEDSSSASKEEIGELDEYADKLFQKLHDIRHSLAQTQNIMPHTIASDIALQQLALKRPMSINNLIQGKFDGMSTSKIEKFGKTFIDLIKSYVGNHPPPLLTIKEIISKYPVQVTSNLPSTFSATQKITVDMFINGKSPEFIANSRNLAISTIMTHLSCGIKSGYNIDIKQLISAPRLARIVNIIQSPLLKNDTSRLAPIKNNCPPSVSYEDIKVAIAYVEVRNHLKNLNIPYQDDYALSSGNDVQFMCSAITFNDYNTTNSTDLSQYNIATKNSLKNSKDSERIEETKNSIEKVNVLKDMHKTEVKGNIESKNESPQKSNAFDDNDGWDEDDFLTQNIDVLDQIELDSLATTNRKNELNNSGQNDSITDISLDENKFENCTNVVQSEKHITTHKSMETDKSNLSGMVYNTKSPGKEQKKSKALYLNDSDTDEDTKSAPSASKRKLPDWMKDVSKDKCVSRKKMARNCLFD